MRLVWTRAATACPAICHRYRPQSVGSRIEHLAARPQARLIETQPAELAPVEEQHIRGALAQDGAGTGSPRSGGAHLAGLPAHRLEIDQRPAHDARAQHRAEDAEQGRFAAVEMGSTMSTP